MKKIIIPLLYLLIFIFPIKIFAVYNPLNEANNKFGIHILFTEELEISNVLVNSSGGDWGYITIPLQSIDKNLEKWSLFMKQCKKLHLIPIIRLATFPVTNYWPKPTNFDLVDFANFLDSLDWPTKNRYIIVFNEPNRAEEWGGDVNPAEYARTLSSAIEIFKKRGPDFFILNAGLDAAAPNNHVLMSSYDYMLQMNEALPGIFNNLDGWNSHSYPNPNFSAMPLENRKNTIYGYKYEIQYLKNYLGVIDLPVFITETGWNREKYSDEEIGGFFSVAYQNVWTEKNIVAITPFLLQAGTEPFAKFSFLDKEGKPNNIFKKYQEIKKNKGSPILIENTSNNIEISSTNLPKQSFSKNEVFIDNNYQIQFWKSIFEWFLVRE